MKLFHIFQRIFNNIRIKNLLKISLYDPFITHDLCGGIPLLGIDTQHIPEQILGLLTNNVPLLALHFITALPDLLNNLFIIISIERGVATENYVKYHPQGPHITLFIILIRKHLRGNVIRRPKKLLQTLILPQFL